MKETYQQLKARQEKETHALPIGFAFTEEQFEEMKSELGVKENSELYRLGDTGGFYRKIDSPLIRATFKRHAKELEDAIFTEKGVSIKFAKDMFYHEMCNYEFGINPDGEEDVLNTCRLSKERLEKNPKLMKAWEQAKKKYYARIK